MSKLYVDEIRGNTTNTTLKNTSGTTALSIDSSARVQRNVQPYFFANGHSSSVLSLIHI